MKRTSPFVASLVALALAASAAFAQDADDRRGSDLNVSISLEDGSRSREAGASLELPIEQGRRPQPAEPEARFRPADFARPNRLEALRIDAGDLPRGSSAVAVRCQAFIGGDGNLGDYFCVSDDNRAYRGVVDAVILAVPTQRFVGARVDGANVRVLMSFAVFIDCGSGSCVAVTGRNHGYHIEQLGLDYVAPQPILDGDAWYDGFDYKLRWLRAWMPRIGFVNRWDAYDRMPYVLAADVYASGIAAPACLYWVGIANSPWTNGTPMTAPLLPPRTIGDLERAISSLGNVRFVPGMLDGTPTTLRLYEYSVARYQPSAQSPGADFSAGEIDCN